MSKPVPPHQQPAGKKPFKLPPGASLSRDTFTVGKDGKETPRRGTPAPKPRRAADGGK